MLSSHKDAPTVMAGFWLWRNMAGVAGEALLSFRWDNRGRGGEAVL